jgi:phosphohistidine swiveling domain-containing protein
MHYHHGPAELDITIPRWGEKVEWVDDLVRSYVEVSTSQGRFEATFRKLRSGVGHLSKGKFDKLVNRSRSFLRLREEMRSYSTRAYYLVRLGLLEVSRRFDMHEFEVFMYDMKEIRSKLIDMKYELPNISKRKLFYQGYRNFKAPNEFGGRIVAHQNSLVDGVLKGLGCSPGEFIGTARVIKDIHQTHTLTKNDILITVFTDPGWTPVLARVGGVVTEVGGILSHAAVIGREYGIPAILNLINATQIIQDGDKIKINGKTGVVEVLEKGPQSNS